MAQSTAQAPRPRVIASPRAESAAPVARRADWRRLAGRVLRWTLVGAATVMLVRFVRDGWPELRESLALLSGEQAPILALAVAAEIAWVYAMSQVYRSALRAFGGRVTRISALRISMAAFTVSRVVPGGGAAGGAVAARELIRLGNPALRTATSMLSSWWISMTGLSAVVFAGVALSVARGTIAPGYLAAPSAALGGFVIGGAAIALAARSPRLRARVSAMVARGAERMGPAVAASARSESLESIRSSVRVLGLLSVFGWGLAVWLFDAAALWLSLAAFGWQLDLGVLFVGFGVANLIGALPELTPGWLGVMEASVAVALSAFGVPTGVAVVGVLVYRLVSYWLPTAAGIPAAVGVLGTSPTSFRKNGLAQEALT